MPRPRLFLIDSYGFLFRAYHARARTGAPPMRTSTGLPTEVVFIFHNMLKRVLAQYKPDYIAAVFESEGKTLREQEFAEYKANRSETPPELIQQIPYVRRLLSARRIPILEYPGYEADDVIGTLCHRGVDLGADAVIVSSDKDMLQLVTGRISMLNPAKDDEWYDPAKVTEFMGVPPSQVADLLALRGDAVDNIPGAPGIGEKGARDLLQRFGSVEAALDRAAEVEKRSYRESLQNHRAQVELSKRLATIATEVPVEWSLDAIAMREPDNEALRQVYTELEFHSQLRELKASDPPPALEYRFIDDEAELRGWLEAHPGALAVTYGKEGGDLLSELRLGLSPDENHVIGTGENLFGAVRVAVEDSARAKVVHDGKSLAVELARHGMELTGVRDDIMLYGFLLSADPGGCSLEVLANQHAGRTPPGCVDQHAALVMHLAPRLRAAVEKRGLLKVYDEIDLPFSGPLARMEREGIRIDPGALSAMSTQMEAELARLGARIHELAGHEFNINSPQQLSKVLFEELKLPAPTARGKGKQMSTAADILEILAEEHEIARQVLDFRHVAKLKGTYVDALPALINPATGRVHTSFNPAGAATGRLSSTNPNLQNIPIRTELGRAIRAAFVPREGWKMVVADYSQIELRLLAHFSDDPVLVDAFTYGEDIHTRTAAEVFGVMPGLITPELRRAAKAVNFGIVYGLSAFGLAGQLGITRAQADKYIKGYFERYTGVRRFIDETIAQVRVSGVTRTLFGRERPIPDMNARNPNARGFAERTAVNTPLQGTAADLIKIAMIRIDAALRTGWKARMLLQVHDELVFEAPPEEVEGLREMVRREMSSVAELKVPLVVDTGAGDNWRDAK
ncbi:MAG: DNA polymerase I [Acidobacteria bacterium]|nr:DNA polymerase I [Acidobacteriota bacterium]